MSGVTDSNRWLLQLCLAQLFIMLVFINYSAVLPQLKQEWGMNNTMAGSIFSVYQLGYIASGVILSTLTDRINTKHIFLISALWSAAANLLFAIYANDYHSAMILRGLTGIGMGGTYMPGLKLVAEKFPGSRRGRAIGIYVGALVLGASLSLLVTGIIAPIWGWRTAFVCCSVGVITGLLISIPVFKGYVPLSHIKQPNENYMTAVINNRPAMLMIFGYAAHMWEMYGMRTWMAPFFTANLLQYGFSNRQSTAWAATASALVVGIGCISTTITGNISDRLGRTKTISVVISASACISFVFGWLVNLHPLAAISVGILYGYLVVADSPVFSKGLTELVPAGYLGAAMGMQSLIGYSMAMISPTVFGWALDLCKDWHPVAGLDPCWGIGFATAGAGALLGPVFMWLLRRELVTRRMSDCNK